MERSETARSDGQARPPAKVLVVDDDPDICAVIRLMLERQGYRVVTATSAAEGEQQLAAERPDLILLDVLMPSGTEGFHFVWRLRRHPDPVLRDTPVVIVSAIHSTTDLRLYPEEGDQEYATGEFLPVQAFLDKPIEMEELVDTVRRVLAARQQL